jgi:hypothetical protein
MDTPWTRAQGHALYKSVGSANYRRRGDTVAVRLVGRARVEHRRHEHGVFGNGIRVRYADPTARLPNWRRAIDAAGRAKHHRVQGEKAEGSDASAG